MRLFGALLLTLCATMAVLAAAPAVLEAWLLAFMAWAGFTLGAMGALATGHLLSEDWLDPVRAPLEAAARSVPALAVMAIPVLAGVEALYPWAGPAPPELPAPREAWLQPWPFRLRGAGFLLVWGLLAWRLTRGTPPPWLAALTLGVLAITVPMAAQDWSLSRDPGWWGSLQGFAVWIEGVTAALAAAALIALLRGEMPDGATGPGEATERALLALGLATIWLWFIQFIVVWMADLPAEAAWYLRRLDGAEGVAKLGLAVPALLLALALAAPPRHRPWRMGVVCALLLLSHLAHLWWALRPGAPVARPPVWVDLAMLLLLGLGWMAWWRAELRGRLSRAAAPPSPAARPATASGH